MEPQDFAGRLETLSKEQLIELLCTLSQMSPENRSCIEQAFVRPVRIDPQAQQIQKHLSDLWNTARTIIENCYAIGGCSYTDEEAAGNALYDMEKLAGSHDLDWSFCQHLVDDMMEERSLEETGFEDQLYDVAHAFCKTPEQLAYLASLFSTEVRVEAHRAAALYEEAGMRDAALELRLNTLENESDYLQVAHQYEAEHSWEKAEEFLLKGLRECESASKERMTRHLAELYQRHHQTDKLEALRQMVLEDDNPYEIQGVGAIIYTEAKKHGNYQRQKEVLRKMIATAKPGELSPWYQEARKVLTRYDLDDLLPVAYEAGLDRDIEFYLDLCMENNHHDRVIRYLQDHIASSNWDSHWGFWVDKDLKYSSMLEEDYPQEIFAYYKAQAEARISWKGDRNYLEAVKLFKRMKAICQRQGSMDRWNLYLESIRQDHEKKHRLIHLLLDV